nr:Gfo/Idh/MocA family oxidoreductase [uncultured Haemophilus sp.]
MKQINVAIAGSGYSTRVFHAPFLNTNARFCVKKCYERSSNRAKEYFPNVEIVRDFDALLSSDIDLVIITTPNQTHYDFTKQALLAKKHVLVEKPLVANSAQALELANLAKQQGVVLYIYQNRRWDAAVSTAREILSQGLIGEVVDCEIRIDRFAKEKNTKAWKEAGDAGTGLVYDLGVHLLDQAVDLFGKPAKLFADIRYQHDGALVDDNFDIHLYYSTGLKVAVKASKYVRETTPQFALHGKLGSYVKQIGDLQESKLCEGILPQGNWQTEQESEWGILHTEINGEIVRQAYPNPNVSYRTLYDNVYESVTAKAAPFVTPEQAAYVLHLIEKAFESAKTGQVVEV